MGLKLSKSQRTLLARMRASANNSAMPAYPGEARGKGYTRGTMESLVRLGLAKWSDRDDNAKLFLYLTPEGVRVFDEMTAKVRLKTSGYLGEDGTSLGERLLEQSAKRLLDLHDGDPHELNELWASRWSLEDLERILERDRPHRDREALLRAHCVFDRCPDEGRPDIEGDDDPCEGCDPYRAELGGDPCGAIFRIKQRDPTSGI